MYFCRGFASVNMNFPSLSGCRMNVNFLSLNLSFYFICMVTVLLFVAVDTVSFVEEFSVS